MSSDNVPLTHCTAWCKFLSQPLHISRDCLWVCVSVGETERREERRCSFMLHKAMMGELPGEDIHGRNKPASLCSQTSLRRGWREGWVEGGSEGTMESQQPAFRGRKVCKSERMCLGGLRYSSVCVCMEPGRHKQTGLGGAPVFCLAETKPP